MLRFFRVLASAYVLCCGIAFTPATGSAANIPPEATNRSSSIQRSDPSAFPELERRAAAQQGLSGQDKAFLMTAAQSEMLQLELSRAAIRGGRNPAVRHFAASTLPFMGSTASRLHKIAKEFGVSLPAIVPDEVQDAQIAFGKSTDRDRAYLMRILADTRSSTTLYTNESARGTNPVLVQYAREMTPQLLQHYRNALRLLATVNRAAAEQRRS